MRYRAGRVYPQYFNNLFAIMCFCVSLVINAGYFAIRKVLSMFLHSNLPASFANSRKPRCILAYKVTVNEAYVCMTQLRVVCMQCVMHVP